MTRGRFACCYSFEPDERCFQKLSAMVASSPCRERIEVIQAGLFNTSGDAYFTHCPDVKTGSSRIRDEGDVVIRTLSLDNFLGDKPYTFLKPDIEGAEPEALVGARESLIRNRLKLAVCVYHRFAHLWEIPLYLASILSDYTFFLRHHSANRNETVLYGRPR